MKYLNDQDPWMLAEHFPGVDFYFAHIWLSSYVNDLKNSCGRNYSKVLAVFEPKFYIHFYYGERDSLLMERHLINKMRRNPSFGFLINKNIISWSDCLRRFAKQAGRLNLKKQSNQKLAELLDKQDKLHTNLYEWGWLSNATDMFHGSFTAYLNKYLAKQINKSSYAMELSEAFNILTTPDKKSIALVEEESLLKIADLLKKSKGRINQKINQLITRHYHHYFYIKHLWLGENGVYSKDYYLKQAQKLACGKIFPKDKIKSANKKLAKIKNEKKKIFAKLKINKAHQDLFGIYADFMLTKIYRRYAQLYWAYEMKRFLKEVAKRIGLSLDEVRYMRPMEMKVALLDNKLNKKEIKKRLKFFLYYAEKGVEVVSTNQEHPLLKQLAVKKVIKADKLFGQIGCLGKAQGRVKIINCQKDMIKMKEGDILVSIATNPDLVPAMKKAAAIVTEQGGVTSHAAIVSREMNTPCVIGTKIATKVLKDGDRVEVDATRGVVKKIRHCP